MNITVTTGDVILTNHRRLVCLLNRLFRRRSMKTSNLRVTGLCDENSPVTSEFPAQRASNAVNVSIWWRHHEKTQKEKLMIYSFISVGAARYYPIIDSAILRGQ